MAYNTFEFDDGTVGPSFAAHVVTVGTGAAINLTDDGVSFTWSVAAGTGRHENPPGTGLGDLSGRSGTMTLTAVGTAPSLTLFSGPNATSPVTVDLALLSGTLTVTFVHPTTPAGNVVHSGIVGLTPITAVGQFSAIRFTTSDRVVFHELSANISCFCAGTAIATPEGPRAVETLAPGDRLLTFAGEMTTVRWLGEQPVNVRLSHPAKVNPIRITAGALADGAPARDLFLSQDHAIAIDGMLINAGALVNGRSIYQVPDMPLDGFTYYHVETDAHELILAENTPAESFIDYAGRDSFVNGEERAEEPPIHEMDLPRISDARLVPEAVRERLAARAGQPQAA